MALAASILWRSFRPRGLEEMERRLRDEIARSRQDAASQNSLQRGEMQQSVGQMRDETSKSLREMNDAVLGRLEQIRQTVDEKLQTTLEQRLGDSFRLVGERLEQVHKGLGEMQTLAVGVGDLKRALTNVKTRGNWGEVQLGALLEQMLAPGQYERNVAVTGGGERVEFAIRLPGAVDGSAPVWLPVDSKFPLEDYQRLVDASEQGAAEAVEAAAKKLEANIKLCAKTINAKYVSPPRTTDFAVLFLATEGLYAEAVRRPGLAEGVQREYRVVLAGPNTFAALLNSLQMGFATLAIQKRSSEVWVLLGAVKTEFAKFAAALDAVKKKLEAAGSEIEGASVRTRAIEKKLKDVQSLPGGSLDLPDPD